MTAHACAILCVTYTLLSGNDVNKDCSGSLAESDLQMLEIKGQTSDDQRPCICSIRSTSGSSKAVLYVNNDRYFLAEGKVHGLKDMFDFVPRLNCTKKTQPGSF